GAASQNKRFPLSEHGESPWPLLPGFLLSRNGYTVFLREFQELFSSVSYSLPSDFPSFSGILRPGFPENPHLQNRFPAFRPDIPHNSKGFLRKRSSLYEG